MPIASDEIEQGDRFAFGENWARFLHLLDDERIEKAEQSLRTMLECDDLSGKTFLDVGSGSGLFSLAARRLNARVHSFDFDPQSVACTEELRRRYFPGDKEWKVQHASALNEKYLARLGQFDVVYSWGVLHHTGSMWVAMENVAEAVKPGGMLFLAIYNTQIWTPVWLAVKRVYNRLPRFAQAPYVLLFAIFLEVRAFFFAVLTGALSSYLEGRRTYDPVRGMNRWRDHVDWIGGYPFETAKPEEVLDFLRVRGFSLLRLVTRGGGLGCNEYVLARDVE